MKEPMYWNSMFGLLVVQAYEQGTLKKTDTSIRIWHEKYMESLEETTEQDIKHIRDILDYYDAGYEMKMRKELEQVQETQKKARKKMRITDPRMTLQEALQSAREGNFVANLYFDPSQSLHYYNGTYYYEDGAVVPEGFLEEQEFAVTTPWRIAIAKEDVDFDKLKALHDKYKTMMLDSDSYMNCRK